MTKAALVIFWFVASFFVLGASVGLLHFRTKYFAQGLVSSVQVVSQSSPYGLFAALPDQIGELANSVATGDARPQILRNFLTLNKSPMADYSELLVTTADKYSLDFRLLPAIAMTESTGGRVLPSGSHNAWGFANGATRFGSWEEAIEKVAKTLKEEYIDKGLVTPEQIMPKYAPPSVLKGGPWSKAVNFFFEKLQ